MTLPDERIRAVQDTRTFLYSLIDPKLSPKVPKYIRDHAGRLLRHYPGVYELADTLIDLGLVASIEVAKGRKRVAKGSKKK